LVANKKHYEDKARNHLNQKDMKRKQEAGVDDFMVNTTKTVEEAHNMQKKEYIRINDYALLNTLQKCCMSGARIDVDELGVLDGFHAKSNSKKIISAWKIKDPGLFLTYQAARNQIKSRANASKLSIATTATAQALPSAAQLDASINECFLFHAPDPTVMHTVMASGFDERYAGASVGTAFGHGSYFGEDFDKCDQYAVRDEGLGNYGSTYTAPKHNSISGQASYRKSDLQDVHTELYPQGDHPGDVFYVFMCRVVLGDFVQPSGSVIDIPRQQQVFASSGSNLRQLAPVPGSKPPRPYDSLVADPSLFTNPKNSFQSKNREFVVMNGNQIYPEFLLAYKRQEPVDV